MSKTDFQFHGSAGEFFRIWIVNLALSVITLGIYSPWAKVRNLKYLYGHTSLDGHHFDYTADPVKILWGRLIALLFLAVYLGVSAVPGLSFIGSLLLLVFMPWAICRGLAFRARFSEYRGLNFAFLGSSLDIFIFYFLLPMVSLLTLGLALPWAMARQKEYLIGQHAYGKQVFDITLPLGRVYLAMISLLGISLVLGGSLFWLLKGGFTAMAATPEQLEVMTALAAVLTFYLAMIILTTLHNQVLMELVYRHANIAGIRFHSSLRWLKAGWVLVTNQLLILASFGLLIPLAKVRWAKYRTATLAVSPASALDQLVGDEKEAAAALGDEVSDVFDVDVAVGL